MPNHPESSQTPDDGVRVLAYGMSPGDDELHLADAVPVDTAVYIAQGAALRRELGARGLLYLDDQHDRWDHRPERESEVRWRNDLIRLLAERIDPGLIVVTHSDLRAAGAEYTLSASEAKRVQALYKAKQEGRYNVYQTQTIAAWVLWLRAKLGDEGLALKELVKMGWVGGVKYHWQNDEHEYSGGEHEHDRALSVLPPDMPITAHYVPPGFDLTRQKRYDARGGGTRQYPAGVAVPYLQQKNGPERVVLSPRLRGDGAAAELDKIAPGTVAVSLLGVRVFARTVLGEPLNGELKDLRDNAWTMRDEEIRDPGEISDAQQHLGAALAELQKLLS